MPWTFALEHSINIVGMCRIQGASQSMPWLADLVESSEGSLDVLPVQCLCEFLLHDVPPEGFVYDDDDDKGEQQKKKQASVVLR